MIPGMVTNLTTKFDHSLYCRLTSRNILSQHKEGNMNVVFLNCVKQSLCILSRTVIKCQCNHRTLLGWIIGSVIIEVVILHALLDPACLHVAIRIKAVCSSVNICKTIYIICTVRILIPFSVGIFMPSRCHNSKLVTGTGTLNRHNSCIRATIFCRCSSICRTAVRRTSSCIRLYVHCFRIIVASSAYMIGDWKNNSSNNKNQQQNRRNHTCYPFYHPASSQLLLFSAHSLTQNSFVHFITSPFISL